KIMIRQYITSILFFYVVGVDNVFLGVRSANNEIPYSVGMLKKKGEPVTFVNNNPISQTILKKIIENPGRTELYTTAGKLQLELVFNESGGTGFQETF
ncbi:35637_t:CDS:2, partial [Gigaspora margarita]